MARNISVGIDIGTYQVKVMVAEKNDAGKKPLKVLGTGYAESKGLRYGYIVNPSDIGKSIEGAVNQAQKNSGESIKRAYLGIGGVSLEGHRSSGSVIVSRADGEVTELDVDKALESAESELLKKISPNHKVIHNIALEYRLDGKKVLGRAAGMKGQKLEVDTLIVSYLEQHLNDLIHAVEDAGVEVEDVVASPLAASLVTLTRTQKIAGSVLANIGAETASIVVFEDNLPISLQVFPIGGNDITNDIALGLKVPIEEAEEIKVGALTGVHYSKKELEEIISARLSDIFELIEDHLKKIGKSGLLPAGVVLTGGGSGIETIEDLAKAALDLPSKIARVGLSENAVKDSSWAVSYGLCILGLSEEGESMGLKIVKRTGGSIINWFRQFLP